MHDPIVLIIGGSSTVGEKALESDATVGRFESIVRDAARDERPWR
jgi:hypothetical protein